MGKQNPETAPSRFILFRIVKNFKQLLIFGGVILVGIIETELSRKPLFWISGFLVLIFLAFGFILFWMATLKK